MPLKSGKGSHSYNVKELMDKYLSSGSIGTSHPKSKKKALAQANAIAYSKERGGKKRRNG